MKELQLQGGYCQSNMFHKILNHYNNKQFKTVIDSVSDSDENIQLLELKGLSALKVSKYECASKTFAQLVKLVPKPINFYHEALANMSIYNYNKAIVGFSNSLLDKKLEFPSKINIAYCYIELKDYKKSEQLLKEVTSLNPSIKESWFLLMKIYRSDIAVNELSEILNLSKNIIGESLEWKRNYAYLLFYNLKYKETIQFIKENNLNKIKDVISILAKCYVKTSKFETAITIYEDILDKEQNAINLYNLAAAYSNLTSNTDLSKAIKYADESLVFDKEFHQSYYCKALASEKMNDIQLALKNINYALELNKNSNEYLYKKAELLNSIGNYSESLKYLDIIITKDRNYNMALRLKGIIQLKQNNLNESAINLKNSILIDDTDQRSIAYYAINQLAQNMEVKEFLGVGVFVKEYQIFNENLEQFNRGLEKDIKQHSMLRKEPNGLAAINGYLTDDLFADDTHSIKILKNILLSKINEYINSLPDDINHHMLKHKTNDFEINCWATWVKGDGFIDKHIHEDSWISGTYYCKIPKVTNISTSNEGYFEYGCIPNDINITIKKDRGYIKPTEGKLVIFPSYLYHQTIPHETDDDRISIAFDLTPKSWK